MSKKIVHGTNPTAWAGSVYKKFCQKHFDELNKLGWLSYSDEIEIVPSNECESKNHIREREEKSKKEVVHFT